MGWRSAPSLSAASATTEGVLYHEHCVDPLPAGRGSHELPGVHERGCDADDGEDGGCAGLEASVDEDGGRREPEPVREQRGGGAAIERDERKRREAARPGAQRQVRAAVAKRRESRLERERPCREVGVWKPCACDQAGGGSDDDDLGEGGAESGPVRDDAASAHATPSTSHAQGLRIVTEMTYGAPRRARSIASLLRRPVTSPMAACASVPAPAYRAPVAQASCATVAEGRFAAWSARRWLA